MQNNYGFEMEHCHKKRTVELSGEQKKELRVN